MTKIINIIRNSLRRSVYLLIVLNFLCSSCQNDSEEISNQESYSEDEDLAPEEEMQLGPPIEVKDGEFTIAVLPDTQYYATDHPKWGGIPEMFYAQTKWIQENQEKENIAYVVHVGDIVENGDNPATAERQWGVATKAMSSLEFPKSIPYGIAVGNHDQSGTGALSSTTKEYNRHFGVERFQDRTYYGGNYQDNNDNHYDLFSAGGLNFIVIYLEYDSILENPSAIDWADALLEEYFSHKAILVSHYLIRNNEFSGTNDGVAPSFGPQGQAIYDKLKHNPNLFMMLCGHIGANGEGYREDTFEGNTIRTFLADYQNREVKGLMRTYTVSVENDRITVKTFSPYRNIEETDEDSKFTTSLFN